MQSITVDAAEPARAAVRHERLLVVAALLLFLCRAFVVGQLVPAWQGPDEPSHFALAKLVAMSAADSPAVRRAVERDVLASMVRHRWWEPYGVPPPDPLPGSFEAVTGRLATGTLLQPVYYVLAAAVLRAGSGGDVEQEYGLLRALSVALAAVSLIFGWAGTRLLFGPAVALGTTIVGALHPQFVIMALYVNPDVLIAMMGAFVWWQAARLAMLPPSLVSIVLMLAVATLAVFTKRSAAPVLACAALMAGIGVFRLARGRRVPLVLVAVGMLVTLLWLYARPRTALMTFWSYTLVDRRTGGDEVARALMTFVTMVDMSWLAPTYRYPAPELWGWIARALTVVGVVGAAALAAVRRDMRRPFSVALLFAAAHVAAVFVIAFYGMNIPDGRFLFPARAAFAVVLWVGLSWMVPGPLRPWAGPMLVTLAAMLDVSGFAALVVPAYVR